MQSASIRKWLLALTLLAVILWTIVHFYNLSAQRSGSITRIILEPLGDFSYRQPKISASKTNPPAGADAASQLNMTISAVFKARSNVQKRIKEEIRVLEEAGTS